MRKKTLSVVAVMGLGAFAHSSISIANASLTAGGGGVDDVGTVGGGIGGGGGGSDTDLGEYAWSLTWADEFNAAAGTGVDKSKWNHDIGWGFWGPSNAWGNRELQYYTDDLANVRHDGRGNLVINALQDPSLDYTSARINTQDKFEQKYGRFEASISAATGQGMITQFWTLGHDVHELGPSGWPQAGEVDVMELLGSKTDRFYANLHGPRFGSYIDPGNPYATATSQTQYTDPKIADFTEDFHEYAVEWEPGEIRWYLDDVHFKTVTDDDLGLAWVFDREQFLILNLAVGGNWPGAPDDTTPWPGEVRVDYVRAYELLEIVTPVPEPMSAGLVVAGLAGMALRRRRAS